MKLIINFDDEVTLKEITDIINNVNMDITFIKSIKICDTIPED